jgi:hypothetical protein
MLEDGEIYPGIDCDWCDPDTMRYLKAKTNLAWCGYYLPVLNDAGYNTAGSSRPWIGKRQFMRSLGWGLAPIYLGKQLDSKKIAALVAQRLTPDQLEAKLKAEGEKDGKQAAAAASSEKFPEPTVVYFDIEAKEVSKAQRNAFKVYLKSWCENLAKAGYSPGMYIRKEDALEFHKLVGAAFIWSINYNIYHLKPNGKGDHGSYRPLPGSASDPRLRFPQKHPKDSDYEQATSWQMAGNHLIPTRAINASGKERPSGPRKVDLNTSVFADPGFPFPMLRP